jgi:hypothetical protein
MQPVGNEAEVKERAVYDGVSSIYAPEVIPR